MKIWAKIFVISIIVTVFALVTVGIILIENTYNDMLKSEINTAITEQEHLNSGLGMYLLLQWEQMLSAEKDNSYEYFHDEEGRYNSRTVESEKDNILKYIKSSAIDINNKSSIIEVHNAQYERIFATAYKKWDFERLEIGEAIDGKANYVVRRLGDQLIVFVSGRITTISNQVLVSTYIKNISYVSEFRRSQYVFFVATAAIFLVVLGIMVFITSKFVTAPIMRLRDATKNIAEGRYNERVKIKTKDELAELSESFNNMAEEIEHNIIKLENQADEKQRFIDNLTHELRTPLTSIIGYAEFVKLTDVSEEHLNVSLEHIIQEGKRMQELSKQMMKLIQIDKEQIELGSITPEEFLLSVYRTVVHRLKEQQIRINTRVPDRYVGVPIPFDINLMKSAILNLVDNGIKASEKGSIIELGFDEEHGKYFFYVKDFGRGIPKEEIEKILEPFYILDKARNKRLGGVGLGLSIVAKIAKIHNGFLDIESELGVGTKIKVFFEVDAYEDI